MLKDATVVADVAEGFRLSRPIPSSGACRAKRTSATITTEAICRSARSTRKGIMHVNKGSGDRLVCTPWFGDGRRQRYQQRFKGFG